MQYGPFSRLLHQMALGNRFIAEASFDVETLLRRPDPAPVVGQKHVFIAGLARAGTTLLMRRFHASGAFRSLTYRDMPFVLMPGTWAWLSAFSRKAPTPQTRAHGDGLTVDYDSPEALEEVFWRVFAGDRYLRSDRLIPMTADDEMIERFRAYVAAVLNSRPGLGARRRSRDLAGRTTEGLLRSWRPSADASTGSGDPRTARDPRTALAWQTPEVLEASEVLRCDAAVPRYLSKNNNNILRLPALCRAFPNAAVIVPFREPAQQADSLLAQHRRFVQMHQADRFARSYMTWLAHHEFGADHRPFRFPGDTFTCRNTDDLNYWMELWINTYEWLLSTAPESVVFQGYEGLCGCLDAVWPRLAALAEIPPETLGADEIALKRRAVEGPVDAGLKRLAEEVYVKLVDRSTLRDCQTDP